MPLLALYFVTASVLWTALSIGLSFRHVAYVQRHRGVVPEAFAQGVSLAEHQKAADYTTARERLARIEAVLALLVAIAWVCGGIDALYAAIAALVPPSLWRGVAFLVCTGVIGSLIQIPLSLYATFGLEQRFGFNRRTLASFATDWLKQAMISLVVSIPLLLACLWVMRSFSGLWWLWTWAGLMILMVAAPTVFVRVIAPRFNRFTPLEDGALRTRIEGLLERSGFRSSGLFVMDASRRSAHGNAYFIGFGRSKRIVLFDTLIARCTPDEIEAVIAHELGHFRHRHVLFGFVQGAVIAFAVLAAFGWLCTQPWLLPWFGVSAVDDAVSLFVCFLLASVVGPLLAPFSNWISRRNEFQADDYARRAVGADAMISALTGLARDNASTLTPEPVYALVHYSHPSVPIRVQHLRRTETIGSADALSAA